MLREEPLDCHCQITAALKVKVHVKRGVSLSWLQFGIAEIV